ncbi:UNKNOWN [Stylonychia lemnae]|uniref:Uncharacterized protein n=1 Tax=Stylonychia lemnae TaxID=5949 RepID=A0A077ZZG4_STYLE|nr:UNKNOWN [Stylonychia lemnae]|eukprot:CDW75316.1 UNKNOWN [Stylonychia lemnae]
MVNKFNAHMFTPLMRKLSKQKLKPYQRLYYESLRRTFFCVSDKVDVSGSTFTAVFAGIYAFTIIGNLFIFREINQFNFYLIGIPYFIYMMFCLTAYRDRRELCFYCKFTIAQNFISLFMILKFYLESTPFAYFWITSFIFVLAILIKGLQLQEEKRRREKRQDEIKKMNQTLFDQMS